MSREEQDAWDMFAAAALASCTGSDGPMMPDHSASHAAKTADALIEERRNRAAKEGAES